MTTVRNFVERVFQVYPGLTPINDYLVNLYAALMTEDDADIAVHLTAELESAAALAKRIGRSVEEVAPVLDKLARNRAIFMVQEKEPLYSLVSFYPGTVEGVAVVMDKQFAQNYVDYMESAKYTFDFMPRKGLRVVPVQKAIEAQKTKLSYEEVERFIEEADYLAGIDCVCRTAAKALGKGCGKPIEHMCLWMGPFARYFVETGGKAKKLTKEEAMAILRKAEDAGLVHEMLCVQEDETAGRYICNCCGCCCQFLPRGGSLRANYMAQVDPDNCVACGACVEACQMGALKLGAAICKSPADDSAATTGDRPFVADSGTSPCKMECPAHISVQGYIKLASQGKYTEALKLIKNDNPLPAVCGQICPHPCESACSRCEVDEAVAIDPIKRFIAERDLKAETRYIPEIKEAREEKVAVIGAGPAGLSCAYYLAVLGYKVTVFEKLPVPGGMLTMGIPAFRLERNVINAEIDIIRELGVAFKMGVEVGKDVTIAELRKQGYKAFFIGIGAQICRGMGLEGEDMAGVIPGLDFLRDANLGKKIALGERVVVVGGGNVAVDVARTAVRMGAGKVDMFCLESRDEMPAWKEELEEAMEEGVTLHPSWGPKRLIGKDGKVTGIEFKQCTSVFDAAGKFAPTFNESVTQAEPVTSVLVAIGQKSDWSCLTSECSCNLTPFGAVNVDPLTWQTDDPDIFAGGDAATGPKVVIDAIASGKQAAISIDRYVQGNNLKINREKEFRAIPHENIEASSYDRIPRQQMSKAAADTRTKDFSVVHETFTEEQVRKETERCLKCGVTIVDESKCVGCGACTVACIFDGIKLIPREERIEPPRNYAEFKKEVMECVMEKMKANA